MNDEAYLTHRQTDLDSPRDSHFRLRLLQHRTEALGDKRAEARVVFDQWQEQIFSKTIERVKGTPGPNRRFVTEPVTYRSLEYGLPMNLRLDRFRPTIAN